MTPIVETHNALFLTSQSHFPVMALATQCGAKRQIPNVVASDCGNYYVELTRPYFVRKVKTNNTVTAVYDGRMNGQDVILKVHHLLGLKDFSVRAQGEVNALIKLE
ncbi:hypothetical protein AC578_10708 [Pseudocercospora eumusae]|uniref:Uncharacterized protein n=1 Tax=Pseudocercospora eumusae TaxID=321146 RepID=A0A139GVJ0_9PEZI|nr:hypothetical protein AC578_10708 [Pseudocercospora eumusae]